jgi:hypothetical protein
VIRDWVWHWVCGAWSDFRSWLWARPKVEQRVPLPGYDAAIDVIVASRWRTVPEPLHDGAYLRELAHVAELGGTAEAWIAQMSGNEQSEHWVRVSPRAPSWSTAAHPSEFANPDAAPRGWRPPESASHSSER